MRLRSLLGMAAVAATIVDVIGTIAEAFTCVAIGHQPEWRRRSTTGEQVCVCDHCGRELGRWSEHLRDDPAASALYIDRDLGRWA